MQVMVIQMNMSINELYHHGVKGMKWGVRRYQNKDGTLTNAGRKRKSGLGGYDVPKGTIMFRAVSNGSKKFMDRAYTYVSITDKYYEHNYDTSDGFEGRFDTDYKLKSTRSLRIASTEDYFHAAMKANGINPNKYLKDVPKDVMDKGRHVVTNLLEHKFKEGDGGQYQFFNNTVKYLKEHGYDGVIDPIDGAYQERDDGTPRATVIFEPRNSVEIVAEYSRK